jgi:hypothetical protein
MVLQLSAIIEILEKDLPDNLILSFIESLKDEEYGSHRNQDYFKNCYSDIIELYKAREEIK